MKTGNSNLNQQGTRNLEILKLLYVVPAQYVY